MKIQTMSIVCGTTACNARCPYCVSKTTPSVDLPTEINWRNFRKACRLAQIGGATTVLLTGKGEPTLYPELILDYLDKLRNYDFPFIELQTNGIALTQGLARNMLGGWYDRGLNTICLSAVHYERSVNQKIYGQDYPALEETVAFLHAFGFTVRLSIMMMKDGIDNQLDILHLIEFCMDNKVKQLTIRPLSYPKNATSQEAQWAKENTIDDEFLQKYVQEWLDKYATPVLRLAHGATVYDVKGQNICLANCLTTNKTDEDMRQIIFFPDGTISHSWQYSGAVLL